MIYLPFFVFAGFAHYNFLLTSSPLHRPTCEAAVRTDYEQKLVECFQQTPGLSEFVSTALKHTDDPINVMVKRCSFRSELDGCLENFMDTISNCINPAIIKGIEVWKKIDQEVADYVCKNNAEVPYKIFNATEKSCWSQGISYALGTCAGKLNIDEMYDIPDVAKHCKQINEFETCMKTTLTEHCPKQTVQQAEPIFQIINNNICNGLNEIKKQ